MWSSIKKVFYNWLTFCSPRNENDANTEIQTLDEVDDAIQGGNQQTNKNTQTNTHNNVIDIKTEQQEVDFLLEDGEETQMQQVKENQTQIVEENQTQKVEENQTQQEQRTEKTNDNDEPSHGFSSTAKYPDNDQCEIFPPPPTPIKETQVVLAPTPVKETQVVVLAPTPVKETQVVVLESIDEYFVTPEKNESMLEKASSSPVDDFLTPRDPRHHKLHDLNEPIRLQERSFSARLQSAIKREEKKTKFHNKNNEDVAKFDSETLYSLKE